MRSVFITITAAAFLSIAPSFPVIAEEVPSEQEVRQAEGEPPVIPHAVKDHDTAKECLACHKKGKKKAPVTSHPDRKLCTQCHVAGAISEQR